jgi:glutamate formiminotransferase/formiminotetrahydrofolate cyclodeaminase
MANPAARPLGRPGANIEYHGAEPEDTGRSMKKIVECVPNFSEGRDRSVIDAIAESIRATDGCALLDADTGRSTHRTVFTFVGSPEAVVEGALAAARTARRLIDMRRHRGEHPRIGALDVCPFVPVSGVTLEECVGCAVEFGRRLAAELSVPVYLYEAAARAAHRRTLKQIREGEYEALALKLAAPEWAPDFGPATFVPEWGATVTGARFFLIAYNVNILGTKEQAHRIALNVREQGRGTGSPGRLKAVRAVGWWIEEYGLAQVSMNLEDYRLTPLHVAFEACVEEARALRVGVAGSEVVGLVPREALMQAAEHYVAREDLFVFDERQRVRLAVERLGLSSTSAFDPARRVIEYMVGERQDGPLASGSLRAFVEAVGARTPTPGGGSVAALLAGLGAALGAMVGWMTYGKRKFEAQDGVMRRTIPTLDRAMKALIPLVDADSRAFEELRLASALPKESAEEKVARAAAVQAATRLAIEVPLEVIEIADGCWDALVETARHGNVASRSDLEVGAKALEAGIWGASRNVAINLGGLEDAAFKAAAANRAESAVARAATKLQEALTELQRR